MIDRVAFSELPPARRADLLLSAAQSDLAQSLWRAALGDAGDGRADSGMGTAASSPSTSGFDQLVAMLVPEQGRATAAPASPPAPAAAPAAQPPLATDGPLRLGANAQHGGTIQAAADRAGIPAPALAAIIDAEAAKDSDGSWRLMSRNPRSSAAGIGQFLSSTWLSEAERAGTWLNAQAQAQGWIDGNGRVLPGARSTLLQLRYDATAAIEATADYAAQSLSGLRKAGVMVGDTIEAVAKSAYLGHHLGLGDATRFLKSGLSNTRARTLLAAQVGLNSAGTRIAEAGDAIAAHRNWLGNFLDRKIRPDRFTG